jgi:hypothetical protein
MNQGDHSRFLGSIKIINRIRLGQEMESQCKRIEQNENWASMTDERTSFEGRDQSCIHIINDFNFRPFDQHVSQFLALQTYLHFLLGEPLLLGFSFGEHQTYF